MGFGPRRMTNFLPPLAAMPAGKGLEVPPPPPAKEVAPPPQYKDTEAGESRQRPAQSNKPWWVTDERKDAEGPLTL